MKLSIYCSEALFYTRTIVLVLGLPDDAMFKLAKARPFYRKYFATHTPLHFIDSFSKFQMHTHVCQRNCNVLWWVWTVSFGSFCWGLSSAMSYVGFLYFLTWKLVFLVLNFFKVWGLVIKLQSVWRFQLHTLVVQVQIFL